MSEATQLCRHFYSTASDVGVHVREGSGEKNYNLARQVLEGIDLPTMCACVDWILVHYGGEIKRSITLRYVVDRMHIFFQNNREYCQSRKEKKAREDLLLDMLIVGG